MHLTYCTRRVYPKVDTRENTHIPTDSLRFAQIPTDINGFNQILTVHYEHFVREHRIFEVEYEN